MHCFPVLLNAKEIFCMMDRRSVERLTASLDRRLMRGLSVLEGASFVCSHALAVQDEDWNPFAGPVLALSFSNRALGGSLLACGTEHGDITFSDTRHRGACRNMHVGRPLPNSVFDLAWSSDDTVIYVGGATRTCAAWDVETSQNTAVLGRHGASIKAVTLMPRADDREWDELNEPAYR